MSSETATYCTVPLSYCSVCLVCSPLLTTAHHSSPLLTTPHHHPSPPPLTTHPSPPLLTTLTTHHHSSPHSPLTTTSYHTHPPPDHVANLRSWREYVSRSHTAPGPTRTDAADAASCCRGGVRPPPAKDHPLPAKDHETARRRGGCCSSCSMSLIWVGPSDRRARAGARSGADLGRSRTDLGRSRTDLGQSRGHLG